VTTAPAGRLDGAAAGASRHAYPAGAMLGDYLRAAAGLVPCLFLLFSGPVGTVPGVILAGLSVIFGVFLLRTILRHLTRIEMSEEGVRTAGLWRAAIAWDALDRMKLGYYSTRRDRKAGWMQLELGAGRSRVRLDSRIEGFDAVVRRAAEVAQAHGLELNEATQTNLQALGIRLTEFGTSR
jgi:hypothetical protein